MKTVIRSFSLLASLVVLSCVTINIYFPAEEMRGAADKIVNEVWGERPAGENDQATPPPAEQSPGSSLNLILLPANAYAAQDINVSTPAIRALKGSIKDRAGQLIKFLASGHAGLGRDGLIKIRNTDGLSLRDKGQLNQLVKAENQDREQLYQEIAKANDFPDKADEVQNIFAASWREKAQPGWYIENPDGSWKQK